MTDNLETIKVLCDPDYAVFGLHGEPIKYKQHQNQQNGLDLYVKVINFNTSEWCFKKLYQNSIGLHFKHTGYSPMYLKDFTLEVTVVPFQVLGIPED